MSRKGPGRAHSVKEVVRWALFMAVRATTAAAVVLLQVLAHHRAVGCVKEHARFSPPLP